MLFRSGAAPVEVVLTNHCGSVEVTPAFSDSSQPLPNLMAVLLRKVGDELVIEKQAYQGGRGPGNSPGFLFQAVTPGDYMVYAWPQDSQIEYASAEYMRQFESYGKQVTVTEDNKVSVTIEKVLLNPEKN